MMYMKGPIFLPCLATMSVEEWKLKKNPILLLHGTKIESYKLISCGQHTLLENTSAVFRQKEPLDLLLHKHGFDRFQ